MAAVADHSDIRFMILGDAGVGKTTVLGMYTMGAFREGYRCTVGIDFMFRTVEIPNHGRKRLVFWDTAGTEIYRSIGKREFHNQHVLIFVFDLSRADTRDSIKEWMKDAKKNWQTDIPGYEPIEVIMGLKSDLLISPDASAAKDDTPVTTRFGCVDGLPYFEVSAKKPDKDFPAVFEQIALMAADRIAEVTAVVPPPQNNAYVEPKAARTGKDSEPTSGSLCSKLAGWFA